MARDLSFDWYLAEWMGVANMTQADLCRETGYPKAKMSELVNGKSRYNRDIINELSRALHVQPYELLMHPEQAMALRRQREDALRIVGNTEPLRTGTDGA